MKAFRRHRLSQLGPNDALVVRADLGPSELPPSCRKCARLADPAAAKVTLLSGLEVCTWCEAWRAECADRHREASALLRLPTRERRREHLESREAQLGPEYRRRLESATRDLWARRRAGLAGSADSCSR